MVDVSKIVVSLIIAVLILGFYCGGNEKQSETDSPDVVPEKSDTTVQKSIDYSNFTIDGYLDTVTSEPERVAALFLKASVKEGDYRSATNFLCEGNREIIRKDSLMDYIAYGKSNPEWDKLTELRYSITRRYIPVLAAFNDIPRIKTVSCDSICRIEYDVTGPLFVNKIFDQSLGENGKSRFDRMIDSSLDLSAKEDFYNYAFIRLEKIADSMDFYRRKISDTLILLKEEDKWKVCKIAETSFGIFSQQK
jgi:hypothetical protein